MYGNRDVLVHLYVFIRIIFELVNVVIWLFGRNARHSRFVGSLPRLYTLFDLLLFDLYELCYTNQYKGISHVLVFLFLLGSLWSSCSVALLYQERLLQHPGSLCQKLFWTLSKLCSVFWQLLSKGDGRKEGAAVNGVCVCVCKKKIKEMARRDN